MKVLHVISGLRGGGAEHFVLELCRQSLKEKEKEKDIEMNVLTLSGADEIIHKFRGAGIKVFTTSDTAKQNRRLKALKGFRILLKHPHDVVHAHMFHACMVACFAKLFRPSLKIIFTLHNNYVPQLHRRLFLFLTQPLRKTDIIFPGMQRKWYQKKKSVVVANGINVTRFNHLHIDKPPLFTCAFIGRLNDEKNPLFLVELAKSLLPEHNFIIRIAGDGPLKTKLNEMIAEQNLGDHFQLLGHVDDVADLLAECHCLLIPSLWEGMPLVLLEAGASGIPVIATPVGNIPSLLNNTNGYIGNTENFRKMAIEMMDNYGEALIRARRLMQKVNDDYGIKKSYQQHLQIYRQ